MDAHGHPILSVYLDLDPTRFPTPDTRQTEFGAVLDDARRRDVLAEIERQRVEILVV